MLRGFYLAICLTIFVGLAAWAQKPEIYGVWYFDRFGGPHGEIISDNPQATKANQQNTGMSFNFTKDNMCLMMRKDGSKHQAHFQLLSDSKEIILDSDTLRVMLLTSKILELYPTSETRPAMFLKRSKYGKTPMSAP